MMLTLTREQLIIVLNKFEGKLVEASSLTNFQKFSAPFFTNSEKVSHPHVSFTTQLNISNIYAIYNEYYKSAPGATFTAYLKWNLIKSMQGTPLTWRYINNRWYEFKNLPLEISVYVGGVQGQLLYYLDNPAYLSWDEFCKKHAEIAKGNLADELEKIKKLPFYALAHEIVGLYIPGELTSYQTATKVEDSHQPQFVFNKRVTKPTGEIIQPLSVSFSYAVLVPGQVSKFVEDFKKACETIPLGQYVQAKL
jgi:chloramphenicol O-acetyltransferase